MGKHVLSFLSMKAWHPSTKKNQMKKIEAEQEYVKAKKLQEQYAKQILQERAELEEKRKQEEEKKWIKKQLELKEQEKQSYAQIANKQSSSENSKKVRRGKRKSKNVAPAGKSTTEILSNLGVLAKKSNCDFMYMPPPGLKEAQDRLEKDTNFESQFQNPNSNSLFSSVSIQNRGPKTDNTVPNKNPILNLCSNCKMYGHLAEDAVCPCKPK